MHTTIIGIHGLSNKPANDVLHEWWLTSMEEGLEKNAGVTGAVVNLRSVYWADAMYDDVDPEPEVYEPAADGALQRYDEGVMDKLRFTFSNAVGDLLDEVKEQIGLGKTADLVLKKKLPDLSRYYQNDAIRTELRARLMQAIRESQGTRTLIVAHSMGSIIAYDVLRQLGREQPERRIDHFLTIGSPLGMPHVKIKIVQEWGVARTPSCVDRWTNMAEKRDPVAVDCHLADDYIANGRDVQVVDDLVRNDWPYFPFHKSYGYLRTPEFTDILKRFV